MEYCHELLALELRASGIFPSLFSEFVTHHVRLDALPLL